jgi:outer membrane lipoprotein-sorting protein
MTEKLPNEDHLLNVAIQALRQESLTEELPPEVLARITAIGTVAGIEEAGASAVAMPRKKKWLGPLFRTPRASLALRAAVLLVVGGLVGVGAFLRGGATLAFADVAKQFRDANTLTFQMTLRSPLIPKLVVDKTGNMEMRVFLQEPGRFRAEGAFGLTGIASLEKDRSKLLVFHPLTKIAVLVVAKGNLQQLGYSDPMEWVKTLRSLAEKSAQPAGKRRIGEVEAQGFLVREDGEETLVLADPKTRLPILIETSSPDGARLTFSDFRFNPQLDDGLFDLDVPEGYKLVPFDVEALSPEESLLRTLRSYAETSTGKFPNQLEAAIPKDLQGALNFICAMMFIESLERDYVYRPEGAKLGDADTILFGYRPAQSTKSRVLYADLHWADVSSDQLPKNAGS